MLIFQRSSGCIFIRCNLYFLPAREEGACAPSVDNGSRGRPADLVFAPTPARRLVLPEGRRRDLHLDCAMLTAAFADGLRGSFRPQLAWTCNHRPGRPREPLSFVYPMRRIGAGRKGRDAHRGGARLQ